jgi:hypothetical protein
MTAPTKKPSSTLLAAHTDASVSSLGETTGAIILSERSSGRILSAHFINAGRLPHNNAKMELQTKIAALMIAPAGMLATLTSDSMSTVDMIRAFLHTEKLGRLRRHLSEKDLELLAQGLKRQSGITLLTTSSKRPSMSMVDTFTHIARVLPPGRHAVDMPPDLSSDAVQPYVVRQLKKRFVIDPILLQQELA